MAIEHARAHALAKPWGVVDLRPWSNQRQAGGAIGEIWYERPDQATVDSSLLLKLLFTSQRLSIQVHPDDTSAHSIGLPRGKTEAWYVLSAAPDAKVAVGLTRRLTRQQLREAIGDGTILDLVRWRTASAGDVIFVPAGTIHAIGAGLVIAEIQQRSDATFRLFDYGRPRELHVERAISVAKAAPADPPVMPSRLTDQRTLLVSSPDFAFERIDLAPDSKWSLTAEGETWLLVIGGTAVAGALDLAAGDGIFAQSDRVDLHAGTCGVAALVAYAGSDPARHLLQRVKRADPSDSGRPQVPAPLTRAKATAMNGHMETTK
jgi:mannose-6-phosphate isomerase